MQLANSRAEYPATSRNVRRAKRSDADEVLRLLRTGMYIHIHIDWRPPGEWLGHPGFVVFEHEADYQLVNDHSPDSLSGRIIACLAVAAEPPPAAWVRVAAVEPIAGIDEFELMFTSILDTMDPGIKEIAWFLTDYWPLAWLEKIGFEPVSEVLTFHKHDLDIPSFKFPENLEIRTVLPEELSLLADMETAAFDPRWRHSAQDLALARRHAISFDVAVMDGEPVGFQFSTGGNGNAHLSRMTVHPAKQGRGIGAALLAWAIQGYKKRNLRTITLNTQSDNLASQRLYQRFGFQPTGHNYPIWSFFPKRHRD